MRSLVESVFLGPINHIYNAAIPRSFFLGTMEGFWEIFEIEVFVEGLDAVFGTEFQHFFHLLYGTDVGTCHCDLVCNQVRVIDLVADFCWRSA